MTDKKTLQASDSLNYDTEPPMPLNKSWGKALCESTAVGLHELQRVLDNYHAVLDEDILLVARRVQQHPGYRPFRLIAPCGQLVPADGFKGLLSNGQTQQYMQDLRTLGELIGIER